MMPDAAIQALLADSQAVAVASLVVSIVTLLVTTGIALLALKFTATPSVRVSMTTSSPTSWFAAGEEITLDFHLWNVGHWYAKPAATSVLVYLNFEQDFTPVEARWGSVLQNPAGSVRRGKGNSHYFRIHHLHLFHGEPPETIRAVVRAPQRAGRFRCWLTLLAEEGDCGVHDFLIRVR
jgi:hypothetical protein